MRSYSNQAGTRAYKLYVPSGYHGQPLPLIVDAHQPRLKPMTEVNRLAPTTVPHFPNSSWSNPYVAPSCLSLVIPSPGRSLPTVKAGGFAENIEAAQAGLMPPLMNHWHWFDLSTKAGAFTPPADHDT